MPSVAGVIIGNEILSGKFPDENGPFLIRRCRELGADLGQISVVPDEMGVLVDEVRRCAGRYDWVVTSGGVGPTHDDITLAAIGKALDAPLFAHPELVSILQRYGLPLNDATLQMARVPEGTVLEPGPEGHYPVVRVDNIVVLPGVPKLFRSKFDSVAELFRGAPIHTARLYTQLRETEIAGVLTDAQERFSSVSIGSYPRFEETAFRVIVTLESRQLDALDQALAWLRNRMATVKVEA